jgi:hypothetical protein
MSIRRRRLSSCLRTVIDEMLHALARDGHIGRASPIPPQAQTLRLEERILMSATPVAAVADAFVSAESLKSVLSESCSPAEFESVSDESGFSDNAYAENEGPRTAIDGAAREQADVELIVIDSRVQETDELLSVLFQSDRSYRLLRLEADQDGIVQITERLEELQPVSAIHLISHGRSGEVEIGSTLLHTDTLSNYHDQLQRWQSFLQSDADLLIYGCDVAGSPQGQQLMTELSRLTGADVGGSDDATGHKQLGGDWDLEFLHGTVFTDSLFSSQSALRWTHILQSKTLVADTTDNIVSATATPELAGEPQLIASNETLVNTISHVVQTTAVSGRGSQQAVATDALGNSIVVWSEQATDGSGWGVYARRFFADSQANGDAFLVNSNTVNDQQWASVAMNEAGHFVIAWTASEQDGDGLGVYLKRYRADGSAMDSFDVLANHGQVSGDQFNPVIALNDGGQGVVAWQYETSSTKGVHARTFNLSESMTSLSLNTPLITVSSGTDCSNPSVDINNDGKFVIAWQQNNKAFVQRFDSSGEARGPAIDLNPLNLLGIPGRDSHPVVGIQSTGDFFVVLESETIGVDGLWGRRYSDLGVGYGLSPFQIAAGDDHRSPSISIGRDDSMAVVYEADDANRAGVFLQKYSAGGVSLGTEIAVNQTTSGNQMNASVAALSAQASIVVWSGKGTQPEDADHDGVFIRNVLNAPPLILAPADVSVPEDTTLSSLILTVADGDTLTTGLTVTAVSNNSTLISDSGIVLTGTGSTRFLSLTPNSHQHGTAEITLSVSDGITTTTTTFQLTVTPVDDRPVAVDDVYVTDEDIPLVVDPSTGLLSNDIEPDHQELVILDLRQLTGGTLELNTDGSFMYLPPSDFHGSASFQYLVDDGASGRTGYWNLDGTAIDRISTSTGSVDGAVTTEGVWGQALQFDGVNDAVRISDPAYSTAFAVSFWFRVPDLAGTGFQYLYSHGGVGDHDSLNIYLTESSTVGTNASNVLRTRFSNGPASDSVGGLDINAASLGLIDNQWHQYTLTVDSPNGLRVFIDGVQRAQDANGDDVINPDGDAWLGSRSDGDPRRFFSGSLDTLQIFGRSLSTAEVADLYHGEPSVGEVQIAVTSVNDLPILQTNAAGMVLEGSELLINEDLLQVSDVDSSASEIIYTLTSLPEHGWLQRDGTSLSVGETFTQDELNRDQIRFLHDGSEWSSDGFMFTVSDGSGGMISEQTFLLSVVPVNRAPEGSDDTYDVDGTRPLVILDRSQGVLANDSDFDGDVFEASLLTGPSYASGFGLNSDGTFWYQPQSGYSGTDTFTYIAADSWNQSTPVSVTLLVNQPPTIVYTSMVSAIDDDTMITNGLLVGDITIHDDGIGSSMLTLAGADAEFFQLTADSQLRMKSGHVVNYEVKSVYEVVIIANDPNVGGPVDDSISVTISVRDINENPIGLAIPDLTLNEDSGPQLYSVGAFFSDPDADALNYSVQLLSQSPGLLQQYSIDSVTAEMRVVSKLNAFGDASFLVTATDPDGLSVSRNFSITVASVNDAPTVQPWHGSTYAGLPLNVTTPGLLSGATDVEGDVVRVRLVQAPSNGTVQVRANGSFTYTPAAGFVGVDSWLFATTDGRDSSAPAVATIVVNSALSPTSTGGSDSGSAPGLPGETPGAEPVDNTGQPASVSGSGSGPTASGTDNGSGPLASAGIAGQSDSETSPSERRNSVANGTTNPSDRNEMSDEVRGALISLRESDQSRDAGDKRAEESGTENARRNAASATVTLPGPSGGPLIEIYVPGDFAVREEVYRQLADQNRQTTEQLERAFNGDAVFRHRIVGSVGVVTTSFSVGYLMWAIRGGMLLSGLLAQMPAWTMLDPLLVVDDESTSEDKESLQNIIDRQQRQLRQTAKLSNPETDPSKSEKG